MAKVKESCQREPAACEMSPFAPAAINDQPQQPSQFPMSERKKRIDGDAKGSGRFMSKLIHGLGASLSSNSNHSRRSTSPAAAREDQYEFDNQRTNTISDAPAATTATTSVPNTASAPSIDNTSFPVHPVAGTSPYVPSAMQILESKQQHQNRRSEGFSKNSSSRNSNSNSNGSSGIHLNFPVFSIGTTSTCLSGTCSTGARRKKGLFRKRNRHKDKPGEQHQRARRSSSVSFSAAPPEVAETFSRSHLTDTERSSVWYDAHDVVKFKSAIRMVSAKIRMSARQRDEDERAACSDQKSRQLLKEYRAKTERDLRKAADDGGDNLSSDSPAGEIRSASEPCVISSDAEKRQGATESSEMDIDNPDEMEVRGLEHRTSFERQRNKVLAMKSVIGFHRKIKARRAAVATTSIPETSSASNQSATNDTCRIAGNETKPQSILIRPKQTPIGAVGMAADPVQPPRSFSLALIAHSTAPLNDTVQPPAGPNEIESQDQSHAEADPASQQSDAQELANFTTKVNRYAALVAARAAQEDFKEAYPDIVAARRQMSEQISSRPMQRLPMGSGSEGEDAYDDISDDESIDLALARDAARRIGGGRRRPRRGKRKSDSELFDSSVNMDVSSSALGLEGGNESFLAPLPSDLLRSAVGISTSSSVGIESGVVLAVPTASQLLQLQGQVQVQVQARRRKSDNSMSSTTSIKGDGQQLEVEDGQSRKRRSVTGELAEGLEQFILEERKKDEEEE